jgi:hypothetical protein
MTACEIEFCGSGAGRKAFVICSTSVQPLSKLIFIYGF